MALPLLVLEIFLAPTIGLQALQQVRSGASFSTGEVMARYWALECSPCLPP